MPFFLQGVYIGFVFFAFNVEVGLILGNFRLFRTVLTLNVMNIATYKHRYSVWDICPKVELPNVH